ncbi:ABC transporter permease [Desulfurella sp.]|uniref:ABC transporter permease n=1 Tax=Desulfurella sp. TaxID=1962857 RepID=UPI003D13D4B6
MKKFLKRLSLQTKQQSLLRVVSLIIKETYQILRDPSSILIAFILPIVLLIIFGYGVSLDLRKINIGVAMESNSLKARSLLSSFESVKFFNVRVDQSTKALQPYLIAGRINAILVIPQDFSRRLLLKEKNPVQIIIRGTDANTASLVKNYIDGTYQKWLQQQDIQNGVKNQKIINIDSRIWFNSNAKSSLAILPGSIAIIMTLIGTMLTSLVIAREWERGTMEALLSTPVTKLEFLISKFFPYFVLGMIAMGIVTIISIFIMKVPMRGSILALIVVSGVFLIFALSLGLVISAVARNQFIATQVALIVGFLPSFILSGLVFDINSMPLPIQIITYILPPRYFVTSLQTIFLTGDVWKIILPDTFFMLGFGLLLTFLLFKKTKTDLED